MIEERWINKEDISSHFIECLVWNAPDYCFKQDTYREIIKAVSAVVSLDMNPEKKPDDTYEYIHRLQWLFKGNTEYTPQKAKKFMDSVWDFAGF